MTEQVEAHGLAREHVVPAAGGLDRPALSDLSIRHLVDLIGQEVATRLAIHGGQHVPVAAGVGALRPGACRHPEDEGPIPALMEPMTTPRHRVTRGLRSDPLGQVHLCSRMRRSR